MIVNCPNCETQFNLDAANYAPGRKARCSVCSTVFILPAPIIEEADSPTEPHENTAKTAFDEFLEAHEAEEAASTSAAYEVQKEENESSSIADGYEQDAGLNSEKDNEPLKGVSKKNKGSFLKRFFIILGLLLCLLGLASGAYLIYFQDKISLPFNFPFGKEKVSVSTDPVAEHIADLDKVRDLLLIDVSHKYIQNVKLGPLVVITGKVKNNFPDSKALIQVEASLLDKSGKILVTQQMFAGIEIPELHLQVMSQKQLTDALSNRYNVVANNTNVLPGTEVPFTVVFVYPPSNMAEYTVVVADVKDAGDLPAQWNVDSAANAQ